MTEDVGGYLDWLGVKYLTLQDADSTGGSLSVTRSLSPAGSGPPRHIHHAEDESFYILDGRCDFWLKGEVFHRCAGETMFIPRGTEHTFRIPDGAPCDHLVIMTPGGFEGFFAEMAKGQFRIPDDMGQIAAIAVRFNLSFTGPPLSAEDVQR
ncbi:cupin domain-containing protein [Tabrizicola sp. BL-A-41-H6]|uniref:cupin domain-containing protein n=1 Tax=Tabrizicola sp. BL-A-41-H6 TaxID=3421107 RepID=UPI003D676971